MATNVETFHPRQHFPTETLTLDFHGAPLTEEQFEKLCRNNQEIKFEISAKGELVILPLSCLEIGWKNAVLSADIGGWSQTDGTGIAFGSSVLFTFPNGAKRSPDVSWMTKEKWNTLSPSEKRKFSRIVPDFVLELLSPSDYLAETQGKMEEYMENGVRLGWLIDPDNRRVYIYRGNGDREVLDNPETLSGEDVLRGLELDITRIW